MADPKQQALVTLEAEKPSTLSALSIDPKWIAILALAAIVGYMLWKQYQD